MDALLETLKWLVPSGVVATTGLVAVLKWLSRSPISELKRQLEKLKAWKEASETAKTVLGRDIPGELKYTSQLMLAPQLRKVTKFMYQIHDRSSDPQRLKKLNWGASLLLLACLVELYWPGINIGMRVAVALPGCLGCIILILYFRDEKKARKKINDKTSEVMDRALPMLSKGELKLLGLSRSGNGETGSWMWSCRSSHFSLNRRRSDI